MTFDDFFRATTGHAPFPFQRAFATAPELPDLLDAPTGSGKTATAVLGWLWRRRFAAPDVRAATPRRLVFCLPMRTLVTQTENAVAGWLDALQLSRDDVGVHALLGGAVDQRWESFPERDTVLIGTQDQLLSRALNRGFAMSRYRWSIHFAMLSDDCMWVLDEIQLFGPGLSTSAQLQALREQATTWFPSTSVWMSATLDERRLRTVDLDRKLRRQGLKDEDASHPHLAARLQAVKILTPATTEFDDDLKAYTKALAAEIIEAHTPGTRTLVVLNRVDRAQSLHQALTGKVATALLHSRFRPYERQHAQQRALAEDFEGVLVATQAVEAGVDVSSRLLFTELAPWSSVVQRVGRCNRRGEHVEAHVRWIDMPTTDKKAEGRALPYTIADLDHARALLRSHDNVGPSQLADGHPDDAAPAEPVLRRRDLQQLFDTTPDLAGHDIDVSPYIRDPGSPEVQVAWREWDGKEPSEDSPALHRDELCRVPLYAFRAFAKRLQATDVWRWSGLERSWKTAHQDRVPPGSMLLLRASVGGYDEALGWTGKGTHKPPPIPPVPITQDDDDADLLATGCQRFVSLEEHSNDVAGQLAALRQPVGGDLPWDTLELAARWHDHGKVHPVFQATLLTDVPDEDPIRRGGPWAKSDGRARGRHGRRHFRHELASALSLLQHPPDGLSSEALDLAAYVVAAHHGKVRMAIRSRPKEDRPANPQTRYALGVWDGDILPACGLGAGLDAPEVVLSLSPMELGGSREERSWRVRTEGLLDRFGPFRLAMLETLVRVADWRGTALHQGEAVDA